MWVVENTNGDGSLVTKIFETYNDAKAYSEWTLGYVRYVTDAKNRNICLFWKSGMVFIRETV